MMKSTLCAAITGLCLTACDSNTSRTVAPSLPPSTPPAATSPSGVPPSGGVQTSAADQALAQRVTNSLREDTSLATVAPNITASANNGTVTLQGSVSSQQQRSDVEAKVRGITGVTQVTNNLKVSSASR
jgi:hypothetical protein